MGKRLSEMSLEELWRLFPISLVAPSGLWEAQYAEMEVRLISELKRHSIKISHIGSTAIKGIWAKNIIDILIEVDGDEVEFQEVARLITGIGFLQMSASEKRISFNYGYTDQGFADKVYHLHLRYAGDNDELYFRDYLNTHANAAKEYEALKLSLWKRYEFNRDAYTNAKTDFISRITKLAKAQALQKRESP